MEQYFKSRFSGNTIFWSLIVIFFTIFIIRILVISINQYKFRFIETLLLILFLSFFLLSVNYLKQIKYLIIKDKKITYYSLLFPFGKSINLETYIGKLVTTEFGSSGSYRVVYLVNNQNQVGFKLMELHYKNFVALEAAVQLHELNYKLTRGEYFRLLFFQILKIRSNKDEFK